MDCKKSSSPKSAAIIGSNDDLLLQILQFLPTKPLIRFKSVSKHFQSLISDPSFGHLHTLRHRPKPPPSFILCSGSSSQFFYCDTDVKKLTPIHFKLANMKLVQSRNGLLLLENISPRNTPKDLFIYNPATMLSRKLVVTAEEETKRYDGVSLMFDPSKSPHYKVIWFGKGSNLGLNEYMIVKMYNSETHTWGHYGDRHITDKQLWNDVYGDDDIYFTKSNSKSLIYYHRANDMWIDTSRVYSSGAMRCYKMESNGRLYGLDVTFQRSWNSFSEPWLINGDCCSYEMFKGAYNHNERAVCVLGMIVRGEEKEGSILLFHEPGKIVIYRFCEDVFEELVDFTSENYYKEGKFQFGFRDLHQFIETFAPV